MSEFRMPSLGADMTQGTILRWLVGPGDQVHRGDIVAVVDTDKAEMDVESFEDGVVERLLAPPGTVVPVGAPLAVLSAGGAGPEPEPAPEPAPSAAPGQPLLPRATPPVRRLAARLGVDVAAVTGTGAGGTVTHADVEAAAAPAAARTVHATRPSPAGRPVAVHRTRARVTPLARRLAAELGVDVTNLPGSGRDGAVVAQDVRRAASRVPTQPAEQPVAAAPDRDRAASMRHAIGALMARAKRDIPHYYLSTTIDLAAASALVTARNAELPIERRLVPAALVLKACAVAARSVPAVNGFWVGEAFVPAEQVNLGVAVSLRGGGLVAPAIADADLLGAGELMAALRDVVARARAGRLRASEMSGGTLTVTNLGDRGVEAVFGVIYPPQVALVGIGRIVERPVAVGGMLTVHPVVTATLSADHRATDGHVGGRYLAALDALLQKPEEL